MTVLTLDAEVLGVTEVPEENSFITSTTSPVVRVVFIFPLTPNTDESYGVNKQSCAREIFLTGF